MKVLLANKYFFIKGGVETSFFDTAKLLKSKGHQVSFFSMLHRQNFPSDYQKYFVSNVDYESKGLMNKIQNSLKLLYSFEAKKQINRLIVDQKPDIAHLHSIYHQISPSILYALKKHNIPIIMTLHDYKITCAAYLMLDHGNLCEACKNGKYYNCFLKGCVKDSRSKSILSTIEMYLHHKLLNIYNLVDVFISPSMFLKLKIEEMGFKGKIVHLPYLLNSNEFNVGYKGKGNYLLYFGRLSKEKGLFTLIEAMKDLSVNLKIIGEGPLKEALMDKVRTLGLKNVDFLGYKIGEDLKSDIRGSLAVIVPSEWYENYPFVILESFALGKPVIGARIGGIPELVKDKETGLTFDSKNPDDLRSKVKELLENMEQTIQMGKNARRLVESELNGEKHYAKLMQIYEQVIQTNQSKVMKGAT